MFKRSAAGIPRKQGLYLGQNPWRKEEGIRAPDGLQLLHRWPRARSRSSHRWSPRPDPSPHRDVIDVQTTLGEQLLHITVRQGKAQVSANRQQDDLRLELLPLKKTRTRRREQEHRTYQITPAKLQHFPR
jgi:hypothetical protein